MLAQSAATTSTVSGGDVLVSVIAGTLLALLLQRPSILEPQNWPFSNERWRRGTYGVVATVAFAGGAFVYTALTELVDGVSPQAQDLLGSAGLSLLIYGGLLHLVPLFEPPYPRRRTWLLAAVCPLISMAIGVAYTVNSHAGSEIVDGLKLTLMGLVLLALAPIYAYTRFYRGALEATPTTSSRRQAEDDRALLNSTERIARRTARRQTLLMAIAVIAVSRLRRSRSRARP